MHVLIFWNIHDGWLSCISFSSLKEKPSLLSMCRMVYTLPLKHYQTTWYVHSIPKSCQPSFTLTLQEATEFVRLYVAVPSDDPSSYRTEVVYLDTSSMSLKYDPPYDPLSDLGPSYRNVSSENIINIILQYLGWLRISPSLLYSWVWIGQKWIQD